MELTGHDAIAKQFYRNFESTRVDYSKPNTRNTVRMTFYSVGIRKYL